MLTVYEQVLIKLGVRPRKQQLEEYAAALVLALDEVVGGPAAATSFVKNRLTSYAQRREVVVQTVNSMRNILVDQNFGPEIDSTTPLERSRGSSGKETRGISRHNARNRHGKRAETEST